MLSVDKAIEIFDALHYCNKHIIGIERSYVSHFYKIKHSILAHVYKNPHIVEGHTLKIDGVRDNRVMYDIFKFKVMKGNTYINLMNRIAKNIKWH